MPVSQVYQTLQFSIKSLLKTYHLQEVHLIRLDKWEMIQDRIEQVRISSDYFQALRLADLAIEDARLLIRDQSRRINGNHQRSR